MCKKIYLVIVVIFCLFLMMDDQKVSAEELYIAQYGLDRNSKPSETTGYSIDVIETFVWKTEQARKHCNGKEYFCNVNFYYDCMIIPAQYYPTFLVHASQIKDGEMLRMIIEDQHGNKTVVTQSAMFNEKVITGVNKDQPVHRVMYYFEPDWQKFRGKYIFVGFQYDVGGGVYQMCELGYTGPKERKISSIWNMVNVPDCKNDIPPVPFLAPGGDNTLGTKSLVEIMNMLIKP